jgi:hypothetical protein
MITIAEMVIGLIIFVIVIIGKDWIVIMKKIMKKESKNERKMV